MAKVIVPKNCVHTHNITVSEITTSNIIDSTYIIDYQLMPGDIGVLGFHIIVDYELSNSTVNVLWTTDTYKNITLKNNLPFGCNFIILTVTGLPKIKNTGTSSGHFRLRLMLNDNTYIYLAENTVAIGSTLTIPNQTYYVDLVNKNASTSADNSSLLYNYNKAVIYNDSYWYAPKEIYTDNNITYSSTITPKNPSPYIFNNIEFRGPNYINIGKVISIGSSTNIIINIDTSNNPSYIFLDLKGMPRYKNTASFGVDLNLYVNISGTNILVLSDYLMSGAGIELSTTGIYIDVVNKKLIDSSLQKAITHL